MKTKNSNTKEYITMNQKKVAFITCVNNEQQYAETLQYIQTLNIPDGYEIDTIAVREAPSMTIGYNAAIQSSDAKYKVYLHQDVLILNKNLISDMLEVFQDKTIGMLGVIGGSKFCQSASYVANWDVGEAIVCNYWEQFRLGRCEQQQEVEAIDGLLMITQYDILWNEAVTGWDFYDISQSVEFRKRGYQIVVPKQECSWVLHDMGYCDMENYDLARQKFCELYKTEGFTYRSQDDYAYSKNVKLYKEKKKDFWEIIESGDFERIKVYVETLEKIYELDSDLSLLKIFLEARENEIEREEKSFILQENDWTFEVERYQLVKSLLRRVEYSMDYEELIQLILRKVVSPSYVYLIATHSVCNVQYVWNVIINDITAG